MTQTPEQIAAGLTKAHLAGEVGAFLWLPSDGSWSRKHPHDALPDDYPGDGLFCLWANGSKLIEGQGLTTGFSRYRLTPLGQQVRTILENRNDD